MRLLDSCRLFTVPCASHFTSRDFPTIWSLMIEHFSILYVFNDYKSFKNDMSFRECIQTDEIPDGIKTGCRDFITGQNFLAQKFTIIFFAVSLGLTLIIFIAICLFQYEKQNRKPIIKDGHDSC